MTNNNEIVKALSDTAPDILAKLESLSQEALGKDIKALTKDEFSNLVSMDLAMLPTEITISAAATRPLGVKYSTNNYHVSVKVDTKEVYNIIVNELNKESSNRAETLKNLVSLKTMMYKVLASKYKSHEQYLRGLIRTSEIADGVVPVGRFENQ